MPIILSRAQVDGAIFDMDGVITSTATLHEHAWAEVFAVHPEGSPDWAPFSHEDYRRFVDGRKREDGIVTFLASRGIVPDERTVQDIAARKNKVFLARVDAGGAAALPGSAEVLRALADAGIAVGLFTASRNAEQVLSSAGVLGAFLARIDGHVAARDNLASKPAPDLPLACAKALGVAPERCALFEDATVGIAAGKSGGFAPCVGVGSGRDAQALRAVGADEVVSNLSEVEVAQ